MTVDQFDLFALPKPALALVLGALGSEDRERLQLVSRSWAKNFATEPLLSTHLVVHVDKLEACPQWQRTLAARGRHAEELTLHAAAQPQATYGGYSYDGYDDAEYEEPEVAALHCKLLRCFKGGRLRRFALVGCLAYGALSRQLAACRSLAHLELRHTAANTECCSLGGSCCMRRLLEGDGEEEPALPAGLQSLSVRAPLLEHPVGLLDDVAGLSALTALELGHGLGDMDFDDMADDLAGLTGLRRLVLRAECYDPNFSMDAADTYGELYLGGGLASGNSQFPLAALTRLTALVLTGSSNAHPGLGRPLNSHIAAEQPLQAHLGLGEGLSELPRLQLLHVDGLIDALPADLWQCTALTRLVIRASTLEPGYGDEAAAPELPALGRARLPHLRGLCLYGCAVQPGLVGELVAAAPHLTGLALGELELLGGGGGGSQFATELALLAKLAGLQELDLSALELRQEQWDQLLPALKPLAGLRILRLADCALYSLPRQGPYAHLEELDLSQNYLRECPAWLPAACPCLRVLNIGFCGDEQGTYEDPAPLALTPAVRQLVTRSSGARLEELTATATRYLGRAGRFAQLEPQQAAARVIFDELLALSRAGQLVLRVADQRFPEQLEQARHESWLV